FRSRPPENPPRRREVGLEVATNRSGSIDDPRLPRKDRPVSRRERCEGRGDVLTQCTRRERPVGFHHRSPRTGGILIREAALTLCTWRLEARRWVGRRRDALKHAHIRPYLPRASRIFPPVRDVLRGPLLALTPLPQRTRRAAEPVGVSSAAVCRDIDTHRPPLLGRARRDAIGGEHRERGGLAEEQSLPRVQEDHVLVEHVAERRQQPLRGPDRERAVRRTQGGALLAEVALREWVGVACESQEQPEHGRRRHGVQRCPPISGGDRYASTNRDNGAAKGRG